MAEVRVALAIADSGRFLEILESAKRSGFRPDQLIASLGVAMGRVPEERLEALRALDGVASVELERSFRAS